MQAVGYREMREYLQVVGLGGNEYLREEVLKADLRERAKEQQLERVVYFCSNQRELVDSFQAEEQLATKISKEWYSWSDRMFDIEFTGWLKAAAVVVMNNPFLDGYVEELL